MPDKNPIENPGLSPEEAAKARKEGARLEAARQAGIRQAANALRIDEGAFAHMLSNTEITIDEARAQLFELTAARDDKDATPPAGAVSMGTEESEKLGGAMVRGLLNRYRPDAFGIEQGDPAAHYRNRSLLQLAEECLERSGVKTRGMSRGEIARQALALGGGQFSGGMHTTSDFSNLLVDAANKSMRKAYDEAPQTWRPIVRIVNLTDFKARNVVQMGEAPELLEVPEHGEFKHGTMGDAREQWSLTTYGRIFALTRQTIINDDLDAFTRLPAMFGVAARNKESDIVWALFSANAALSDEVAWFHADHGNLASAEVGGVDAPALAEMRELMRIQKGLDGRFYLNLTPKFLLAGPQYETAIDQLMGTFVPAQASNVVPNFVRSLTPIIEPRLDADSATAWYTVADPAMVDTIEAGWLQGEEGVQIETRRGFEVDGLEIKARLDFGAKVIEHRSFVKNAG